MQRIIHFMARIKWDEIIMKIKNAGYLLILGNIVYKSSHLDDLIRIITSLPDGDETDWRFMCHYKLERV